MQADHPLPNTGMLRKAIQIEVNDLSAFLQIQGKGDPILYLHGALLNSDLWSQQLEALAGRYQGIAVDLRGHGRTGPSRLPEYSVDVFADDLFALIEKLGLAKVTLCGLSLGGMIAQAFAVKYPERTSRLILCDTVLSTSWLLAEKILYRILGLLTPPLIYALDAPRFIALIRIINRLTRNDRWVSWTGKGRKFRSQAMQMVSGPEMVKIFRAVRNFRGVNVQEIRVPVLILNGEHESPIILRHAGMMEQLMPDVRACLIPGASHLSNLDNPEYFDRAMMRFLDLTRAGTFSER